MLRHWHAQQRSSLTAPQRRFCGIVGVQNAGLRATVSWTPGPPPTLRLTFQNARLASDAGNPRPDQDLDGVSAITRAIDTGNGVRVQDITPLELQAAGFIEPVLSNGIATGALLSLVIAAEGQAALAYRIGQMFSIDGNQTRASMRYLITPEPAQICETGYLSATIVDTAFTDASLADDAFINDAFARNDAAQAAHAAPAGGGQAAPAVGVPVHLADAAPQAAPPAAQLAAQPAAQPPVEQQQAAHAALRLANVQQLLQPEQGRRRRRPRRMPHRPRQLCHQATRPAFRPALRPEQHPFQTRLSTLSTWWGSSVARLTSGRARPKRWRLSPQPTWMRPGKDGASTSGVEALAAIPTVVSLTCDGFSHPREGHPTTGCVRRFSASLHTVEYALLVCH